MSEDRIMMVAILEYEDWCRYIGIKGELTTEQTEILFSATHACPTSYTSSSVIPEMTEDDRVRVALAMLNRPYYRGDTHDQILPEEQLVELTVDNWPKYPVLVTSFATWC